MPVTHLTLHHIFSYDRIQFIVLCSDLMKGHLKCYSRQQATLLLMSMDTQTQSALVASSLPTWNHSMFPLMYQRSYSVPHLLLLYRLCPVTHLRLLIQDDTVPLLSDSTCNLSLGGSTVVLGMHVLVMLTINKHMLRTLLLLLLFVMMVVYSLLSLFLFFSFSYYRLLTLLTAEVRVRVTLHLYPTNPR